MKSQQKELERYRNWQLIFMVGTCVSSVAIYVGKFTDTQWLFNVSSFLTPMCGFGVTWFSNKTNGITRTIIQETKEIVSGGNSFGYVTFLQWQDGICGVMFHQVGSTPMYNVKVDIFEKIEHGRTVIKKPDFKIDETNPREMLQLGTVNIDLGWEKILFIKFRARHMDWLEVYHYKKYSEPTLTEGGRSRYNIKIHEGNEVIGKVLYDSNIKL